MGQIGKHIEKIFIFQFFLSFSSSKIRENIRAGLPDRFGIIYFCGDQHFTKFVIFFHLCFVVFRFSTLGNMKIELFPFIFKRTGSETIPKL